MAVPVSKVDAIYPLDKHRKLLKEWKDTDGTVYKVFRLYGQDGSTVDIEYEIRNPTSTIRPLDAHRRIVAQEQDAEGCLHKLMMTEDSGEVKEYWIEEKAPKPTKRRRIQIIRQQQPKSQPSKETSSPSDEFLLLLSKTHVQDLQITKQLITAEKTEKIPAVFKKLLDNNILSVPVLNSDQTWIGFLDILDIVTWITDRIGENALSRTDLDIHTIEDFRNATVGEVMKENPLFSRPLKIGTSLLSAMEELAGDVHRVPILRGDKTLHTVISQSSILKFVQEHMESLGEKKNMPVSDMYLANQYVLSMTQHEKVIDGFRLIRIAGVHGVAVTDKAGKLVGNLSAKDLKKIASNSRFISRIFKPVGEYLKEQQIIFGRPHETLETIINRIVVNNLHRIYLIDENDDLYGVLSLSDILEELLQR